MRYDPVARLTKYQETRNILEKKGFNTFIGLQSSDPDCMVVRHPSWGLSCLMVYCRLRGWYVAMADPDSRDWLTIYEVPHMELVPSLLDTLAVARTSSIYASFSTTLAHQFHWEFVPAQGWLVDELQENMDRWQRFGWHELPEEELQPLSLRYEAFFFPQADLVLPSPALSWQVPSLAPFPGNRPEVVETTITLAALCSFRECVLPGEELLVLDWQHTCYRLDVHQAITRAYRDEWATPVLSTGDDHVYLAPDFRFGLMSLRNDTLHVFGNPFVDVFLGGLPMDRSYLLRNGNGPHGRLR